MGTWNAYGNEYWPADYLIDAQGLTLNDFAFSGVWNTGKQPATAVSSSRPPTRPPGVDLEFEAKNVYLVLSSPGERPLPVQVLLDGRSISATDAGADVHHGTATVRRQRLYSLVSLPRDEHRRLSLRFAPGVSGYAFTFG
jgi:hypothetical protein